MRMSLLTSLILSSVIIFCNQATSAADKDTGKAAASESNLPLLLDENFANGADRWQPASPEGWKIIEIDGGKAFSSFKVIDLTKKLPHRSPWDVALLKDVNVSDFVLEVKLRETAREYAHRDAVLIFDYQDPSHFYYVHFAPAAPAEKKGDDPHAHQIFIVNNADRAKITENASVDAKWGEKTDWHRLKVVRRVDDGSIEAYFDNMDKPLMTAHDKTFASGRIGIGTFDDTADFAEVKLWGKKADAPSADASYP